MSDTPNMGLTLPVVSVTLGPTYASEINAAFEEIDEHDHSSGKGVQIPSAGLNINANLSIDDYSLTSIGSADLSDLSAVVTTGDRRIFAYSGELYYRDDAGNNVQITSNGAVSSAGTGNISGLNSPASAEFSALNSQFGWFFDTGKQASMQAGDLQIFPFDGVAAYTHYWTIKSPLALAASPELTLPLALGATTLPLVGTSAGVLSFATGLQLGNGSAATPTYGFSGDTNTGMYNTGTADTLGFSTGGTVRLTLNTASLTSTLPLLAPAGTVSAPSVSLSGDTNTGLYSIAADRLGFAAGGALIFEAKYAGTSPQLIVANGDSDHPSISFTGATSSGLYRSGANEFSLVAGTSQIGVVTTAGFDVNGALTATSLALNGGGVFKIKVFTGSLGSGASTNLTAPSGVIYSVSGWSENGGGASYGPMDSDASSNRVRFFNTTCTSTVCTILNNFAGTNVYRVIMFYG